MSSFLHDEKTYIPLLIQALQKEAQEAKPAGPPLNAVSVAKKLVNSLSRELTSQPEPPNVAAATDAELKVDNLQSLGTLLKFLSANKVTINGARVAYTGAEEASLGEDEKGKLSPVTINESRDAATRKWNAVDYHANLPYLISYVKYLQAKAAAMTKGGDVQGKVLEVMVGKLIDQINVIKPDSGLNRKPKSTPDNPNEIPDDDNIDNFGTKVFDAKNPTKDRGNLLLKAKHIKSRAALNAWLQDSPEAQIVMYDDKGQPLPSPKSPLTWTTDGANHCFVLNVLYARAKYWREIAKTPEDEKRFDFYIKKIQEIGPTFAGPDGKACTITGTLQPGKQPAKPGTPGSGDVKYDPNAMAKVIASLPLRYEYIDFDKIDQFFREYIKIRPSMQDLFNDTMGFMNAATKMTYNNKRTFDLPANARAVNSWLIPPQPGEGNPYLNFLEQLQMVLRNTGDALKDLKKTFADYESGESPIRDKYSLDRIDAQIKTPSIWDSNNRNIGALMSQVGTIMPNYMKNSK